MRCQKERPDRAGERPTTIGVVSLQFRSSRRVILVFRLQERFGQPEKSGYLILGQGLQEGLSDVLKTDPRVKKELLSSVGTFDQADPIVSRLYRVPPSTWSAHEKCSSVYGVHQS